MSNKITGSDLERLLKEAFSTTGNPADQMRPVGSDQNVDIDQYKAPEREKAVFLKGLIDNISGITKLTGGNYKIDGVSSSNFSQLEKDGVLKVIEFLNDKSRTFKSLGIKFEDFKDKNKKLKSKSNSFKSQMKNRQYRLINSELLKTKGLFSTPWSLKDPFPEELKTSDGKYPNEKTLDALKKAAKVNKPDNVVSDADISGFILSKEAGKGKLSLWLKALGKDTTSDSIRDAANSMLSKMQQGGKISKDQSEFAVDPYKPDISIKSEYRGQGNFVRPPKHIEEIFATFRGAFGSNTVKQRLEALNKIVVDFTAPAPLEEVDEKDYKPLGKKWTAAENDTSASDFSKLMVLDFFKQIANDMGRKSPIEAGSVFESFLALLVDGTVEGGSLDFDDVVAVDKDGTSLLSLKLLSTTTPVTQAEKTVRQFFEKYGKEARIKYIVAYKDTYKEGNYNEFPIFMQDFAYNDIYKEDGSFKTDYDDNHGYEEIVPSILDPRGESDSLVNIQKYNKTPATYIPPGAQIYKTSAKNPEFEREKKSGMLASPLRQKQIPKKDKLKKSSGAGTIVFGHEHIRKGETLGVIKIPKNPDTYDTKMKQSFEAIDGSISEISKNLELFKSRITSFYASSNTVKRKRYANESYENAENLKSLMDEHIFAKNNDQLVTPMASSATSTNESKITPIDIKKLIEESFKR